MSVFKSSSSNGHFGRRITVRTQAVLEPISELSLTELYEFSQIKSLGIH